MAIQIKVHIEAPNSHRLDMSDQSSATKKRYNEHKAKAPGATWGHLRPILGAIAFGFVFSFGLGNGLPSHVVFGVTTATFQGNHMVDNVPATFTCRPSSSGTWILPPELVLRMVCPLNTATGISDTRLASLTSERRNDKQ